MRRSLVWDYTEEGGDIWNGKWTKSKLDMLIAQKDYYTAALTSIIQILIFSDHNYGVCRVELLSNEAKERQDSVKKCKEKYADDILFLTFKLVVEIILHMKILLRVI